MRTVSKNSVIVLAALLLSTSVYSDAHKKRAPADVPADAVNQVKAFDFQSLMALTTPQMTSVDQLVQLLPDNYKKYFTLMLQSGSAQAASIQFPRVISYGSYGGELTDPDQAQVDRLYIAFQTDKAGQNANALEVIEWVPQSKSFQFYQIDFPIKPTSVTKNPDSCKVCHGNPSRPNWSSYPRWDGALGNNNGLTGKYDAPQASLGQAHSLVADLQNKSPRLKALDFSQFFSQELETPDIYLTDKISAELQLRDSALLRSMPDYPQLKYALAGGFLECNNFDKFFSPALVDILKHGVFDNLKNVPSNGPDNGTAPATAESLSFDQLLKMTVPFIERNGHLGSYYINDAYVTTWFRFIFEGTGQQEFLRNILGNPMKKPASDPSWTYDFVGFTSGITGLRDQFLSDAKADFPESIWLFPNMVAVAPDGTQIEDDASNDSCAALASLSVKATAHYTPSTKTASTPHQKP
jgi:hypothetical protein